MVDSITPTDIPVNDPATGKPWDYVLGYVDGHFGPAGTPPSAWTPDAWARFPGSIHVRCAVLASTLDADVLDREAGDATAAEAVAWVEAKRARGDAEPTVYVGLAEWGALQAAFVAAGVPHPQYGVAAYPGSGPVQETLNGITTVFHQYADPQYGPNGQGSGGHYDLSAVVDGWLTSTPFAITEDDMCGDLIPMRTMGNWLVWVGKDHVQDTKIQLTSGTWQGLPIGQIDDDTLARRRALQAARENAILTPPPPPAIGTVNVAIPTEWRVTDEGQGVRDIKAVTS
jgi:hypothetical protein